MSPTDVGRLPGALVAEWDWQLEAACRGMDASTFFHPAGERAGPRDRRIARAKAICRSCPVLAECLDQALRAREPYGIWGGHSEQERAELLGLKSLQYPARIDTERAGPGRRPGSARASV